jgi:hypothetical protein
MPHFKKVLVSRPLFSILYNNGELEMYNYTYNYSALEPGEKLLDKLHEFINERVSVIECIFLNIEDVFLFKNINVKNIVIVVTSERDLYFIDTAFINNHTSHNFFMFFAYPSIYWLNKIQHLYVQDKIKFLYSKVGFYGVVKNHSSRIQLIQKLNPSINIEKLKQLKQFKNVYWAGSINGNRQFDINFIRDQGINVYCEPPNRFAPDKSRYIDQMIKHQCCCVLSLDGHTVQCYRDAEIGLNFVPNLKFTQAQDLDISANNTIYSANNSQILLEQISKIQNDINTENYSNIENNYTYMNTIQQTPLLVSWHLQAIFEYSNVNINNLITSVTSPLSDKELSTHVNNVNNFK